MKKKQYLLILLAACSLILFGCPPKEGGAGAAGGDSGDILVGEYGSMTGPEATFGDSTHKGIQLALDEINAAGGVKGRKIRLFTEDDQSKPEEAANAVSKLISQNRVVAVLGEVASSNSLAAAPICQQNQVPMISPSSTNPKVTEVGDYIFRVCFTDPYQGESLGRFVSDHLKAKRVAILTDVKSDYSVGLAEFFKKAYLQSGGQIVAEQSYSKGDSDFKAQLTSIKSANPEVIFAPGYYTDIGQIAIQARDLGMKQPLVGGDGWESPKLIEIGGTALEGSYYSNHYFVDPNDPASGGFVKAYQQKYGTVPDALAALGYDSMKLLAQAMTQAEKIDGPSIRDQIAQIKDFQGVTGKISIGADRNPIKSLVVLKIQNGQLTLAANVPPPGQAAEAAPAAAGATDTAPAAAPATDTAPASATQ